MFRFIGSAAAAAPPRFRRRPWPEAMAKTLQTKGASSKLILLRFNPHFSKMSADALRADFLALYKGQPPVYRSPFVEKNYVQDFLIWLGLCQSVIFGILVMKYLVDEVRNDLEKPETQTSLCAFCKATLEGIKKTYQDGMAKEDFGSDLAVHELLNSINNLLYTISRTQRAIFEKMKGFEALDAVIDNLLKVEEQDKLKGQKTKVEEQHKKNETKGGK